MDVWWTRLHSQKIYWEVRESYCSQKIYWEQGSTENVSSLWGGVKKCFFWQFRHSTGLDYYWWDFLEYFLEIMKFWFFVGGKKQMWELMRNYVSNFIHLMVIQTLGNHWLKLDCAQHLMKSWKKIWGFSHGMEARAPGKWMVNASWRLPNWAGECKVLLVACHYIKCWLGLIYNRKCNNPVTWQI